MCSGGEGKKWSCRKAGLVSLQKLGSLVRRLSMPCLSQSQIQIGKMLKPEKWQASFDSEGRVSGFQKALKLIILGGIDPSIRAEVWEFLLGCYALSSTSEYRNQLRVARRDRYNELLKQCQTMHSSVGTGSLAYVVGSKVMDMRKSYRDGPVKVVGADENREETCIDNNDNPNTEDHQTDWNNSGTDTSQVHRRGSSSESVDLVSGRESPERVVCKTSSFVSPSSPYGCASPDGYFDFPSLPVTNLFERNSLDKAEVSALDKDASLKSELRSEDERIHNFRIDKNADIVREQSRSTSEIQVMHPDSVGPPSYTGRHGEIVESLRISDVPEMTSAKETSSLVGDAMENRVSEWLWTLHRIVIDVVRTDSHLEFYEDPGNLGRMSDILAVYAWVDPATGYCQGMSDLVSPFVVLFEDNADAFWCFEMLIRRTRTNFQIEGPTGVMDQLQSLWHILQITDKDIFSHLSRIGAESLHFAFRMLLVLFRREMSFNEALRMWEMMWAADYDESVAEALEDSCLEPLVIQLPRKSEAEVTEESLYDGNCSKKEPTISKSGPISKSSSLLSRSGLLTKSGPLPKTAGPFTDESGIKQSSYHFCGLTRSFWSRNDRTTHVPYVASSSIKKGDDALPVFCVAAILIMNRHKIMKEARSIDDMIQIFNDNVLVFRVRRCIRTAMKLRRKYIYKTQVIETKSHSRSKNQNQVQIQHQTHMENQRQEDVHSHGENQSKTPNVKS